ncbi:MAG TPA: chemotaxis protein CheA, partial [Acidobacteriota bacterium]
NESQETDPSSVIRQIQSMVSEDATMLPQISFPELYLDEMTLQSLTEYEEHRLHENLRKELNIFSLRLVLDSATFDQELREISEAANAVGEIISTLPCFESQAAPNQMIFRLILGTAEKADTVLKRLSKENVEITNLRKTKQTAILKLEEEEADADRSLESSLKSLSRTVRVDIHKLDEVMNVIGELVITKAMVSNLSREIAAEQGTTKLVTALSRAAVDLEKKLNDLQRSVIEARLVPIGQIYNKLNRIIRKLSRETNKKIELQFSGEDTELDKIMIEQLSDPLMHIIRNAIDHGIEPPEERKRSGKPETGFIRLSAFQRGNNVVLQVHDDGRGIQVKKVQEHAQKRGLVPKGQALNVKECIDVIFSPGFSSSEAVTELSGRGVGLDVVKKNISDLKGSIEVFTEEGKGTVFEITLPITLAILQAILVKIGANKYAIPLTSVCEMVRIETHDIQTIDRKEVYYLRDRTLPVIRVKDFFHLQGADHRDEFFMVVVKLADQYFGLLVDELAGEQEIVIKSMGEKLKNIPGIAGAAEIGEQKPILVLDAESMIEEVTHGRLHST